MVLVNERYSVIVDKSGKAFVAGTSPLKDERYLRGKKFKMIKEIKGRVTSVATSEKCILVVDYEGTLWECFSDKPLYSQDSSKTEMIEGHNITSGVFNICKSMSSIKVASVCMGSLFSAALDFNGKVWGIGDNKYGQIGSYVEHNYYSYPVMLADLDYIKQIDACEQLLVALDNSGVVWKRGKISGLTFDRCFVSTPINPNLKMSRWCIKQRHNIVSQTRIQKIACGNRHVLLLSDDGTIFSFGVSDEVQCGYERYSPSIIPREVSFDEHGIYDSGSESTDGEEYTYSKGYNHQEPDCETENIYQQRKLVKSQGGCYCKIRKDYDDNVIITDIQCGNYYSLVTDSLGEIWVFGNIHGVHVNYNCPKKLEWIHDKHVLLCGHNFVLFSDDIGKVYAHGYNNRGGFIGLPGSIQSVYMHELPNFYLGIPPSLKTKSSNYGIVCAQNDVDKVDSEQPFTDIVGSTTLPVAGAKRPGPEDHLRVPKNKRSNIRHQ